MESMFFYLSKVARMIFVIFVAGVEFRTVIWFRIHEMADNASVFEGVIVDEDLVTDYVFTIWWSRMEIWTLMLNVS